jgi:hypothetical protein
MGFRRSLVQIQSPRPASFFSSPRPSKNRELGGLFPGLTPRSHGRHMAVMPIGRPAPGGSIMRWEEMKKDHTSLSELVGQFETHCRLEGKVETTCRWYRERRRPLLPATDSRPHDIGDGAEVHTPGRRSRQAAASPVLTHGRHAGSDAAALPCAMMPHRLLRGHLVKVWTRGAPDVFGWARGASGRAFRTAKGR